jgi:HD-GYP domain-containing protein (c-di-GMP phosphodiesterase class II)
MQQHQLAKLMCGFSHALDLAEGQPAGHAVRCAYLGMHLARAIDLAPADQWELYYTLLLKDLGGSSNAACIHDVLLSDDLSFKRKAKRFADDLPRAAQLALSQTGTRVGLLARVRATLRAMRQGDAIAQSLTQTRGERGAEWARQLRFSDKVGRAIHALEEHWNGSGKPDGLAAQQIPLYARIALIAQVAEIFHHEGGPQAAMRALRDRRASWFDPHLVDAFERAASLPEFWAPLTAPDLIAQVVALEPAAGTLALDDDYFDEIAAVFGQIADAKSACTAGHSARVGLYTDLIAAQCGLPTERRRWLRRAALLHDLGMLGISNALLDKAGPLNERERTAMQLHVQLTEHLLARIDAFADWVAVVGAHHEWLDGSGYPRGLRGDAITLEARILTTADLFDAISTDRPHRPGLSVEQTLANMRALVGVQIDPQCYAALCTAVAQLNHGAPPAAASLAA